MKIAFFTDSWLPNVDGVVTAMLNYRKELEHRGHDVWIFTTGSRESMLLNKDPQVFAYRAVPFPPYPQYRLALNPFPSKAIVEKKNVELVHSHAIASMGLAAIKTARDLDLPLVGTYHTMIPYGVKLITSWEWSQRIAERLLWRAIKAFYQPFDLVTTPSEAARKSLEEHHVDAPTLVVPNGVDINRYNPRISGARVRKELGLKKNEKMIMVAGRLSHEKNVDVIVRALPQVLKQVDARLVITGKGPAEQTVHALAHDLGLGKKVVFMGFVPKERLGEYYSAADVLATASTFETQGLALTEAMACGTPAVGAKALAIPEAVEEGRNGFLFEPFDTEECAEKITKVLTAPKGEYARWSRNARKTAEQYSIPKTTQQLIKAYGRVL